MEEDQTLPGGRFAGPVRRGTTVERAMGAGRANVQALLRHFEQTGFPLAPRFLGVRGDKELLSFIDGETGYPPLPGPIRSDAALASVGRAIRAAHDATRAFVPVDEVWAQCDVAVPADIDCIGHLDLAPWNIVFDGTEVAGIIDWDFARPSNRAWDLAYAAHQFVPFHPGADLAAWGWDSEPDRAARLRILTESYGCGIEPAQIVDLAIVRLASMGAWIDRRVRAGDPAFAVHAAEDHGRGYRAAAGFIGQNRASFLR